MASAELPEVMVRLEIFWENTNLCKRAERKPHMKNCFKTVLKSGINYTRPLSKAKLCCLASVPVLKFGCCNPLGYDEGAKIFHLQK